MAQKMLLGEFRKKTKDLDDNTVLVMYAEKEGIEIPVKTLDYDNVKNNRPLLTLTDGVPGSYSL